MKKSLLALVLLLSAASFAQTQVPVVLQCPTITLDGDNGSGSVSVYTGPADLFGCCIVLTQPSGAANNSYLSADCDSNTVSLTHALTVTSVTLDGRKSFSPFAPFATLVITTPAGQIRKFPMIWQANTNDGTYYKIWNAHMTLPAGTTMFVDVYLSTSAAVNCASGCYASAMWTLQGDI